MSAYLAARGRRHLGRSSVLPIVLFVGIIFGVLLVAGCTGILPA